MFVIRRRRRRRLHYHCSTKSINGTRPHPFHSLILLLLIYYFTNIKSKNEKCLQNFSFNIKKSDTLHTITLVYALASLLFIYLLL